MPSLAVAESAEYDRIGLLRRGPDGSDCSQRRLPYRRVRRVSCGRDLGWRHGELTGVRRLAKEVTDRTAAFFGLFFFAPVLLGLALAVKVTSRGPVFFKQERVGRDGQPFTMLKFRSMVAGADRMHEELASSDNDGNGVLYKSKADPRVTSVASWISSAKRRSGRSMPKRRIASS